MADLFRLLQVLGERIASKNDSGSTTQTDEEDPVEARFRCVIPNLLRGYVDPSKANERELTAILKLLSHTAKKYPGVFYHGKAHAILPVLGRIVPFFAEPGFGGRHGVLFETMAALLSLLRTGDHDIYCQFYLDSLLVVEDLLSIASFYATKSNLALPTMLSITCFSESFSRICSSSSPAPFCDLPACWKPPDGPGILVDVTGEQRWLPFAHWMLKLLSRCLAESSLHVEGLITSSFMSKACTLLCYGDGELQRVCFEFVRIATSVVDAEIIPAEKLILTIEIIREPTQKLGSVEAHPRGSMRTPVLILYPGVRWGGSTNPTTPQPTLGIKGVKEGGGRDGDFALQVGLGIGYRIRMVIQIPHPCGWCVGKMLE